MGARVLRVGERVTHIGAGGVEMIHPRSAAAIWWDPAGEGLCIWAAYQPKGAASLAASYTDLSGNGNDASVGVAPTWDTVNGWMFDGITQYLTTTFVPADDQSQSMIMQVTNCVVSSGTGMLDNTNGNRLSLQPVTGGFGVQYGNGLNSVVIGPTLAAGNVCVAGASGYRDGAAETAALNPPTGPTTLTAYIGATHRLGLVPAIVYMSGYIQAFALYDCILTAPQVLAVAAAMAAL